MGSPVSPTVGGHRSRGMLCGLRPQLGACWPDSPRKLRLRRAGPLAGAHPGTLAMECGRWVGWSLTSHQPAPPPGPCRKVVGGKVSAQPLPRSPSSFLRVGTWRPAPAFTCVTLGDPRPSLPLLPHLHPGSGLSPRLPGCCVTLALRAVSGSVRAVEERRLGGGRLVSS